ncbi:MAG: hypothetical protein EA364_01070 [Balneolaceae bacterium]|nr:MAG: hypothetical protein EA364_01070 [Balneolaceae bacterium]
MKNIKEILPGIFAGLIFLAGCESEAVRKPPVTESENLNNLLAHAPISWINLNGVKVDTIFVPAEHIYEESLFVDNSLYVSQPTQLKTFSNHLITTDFVPGFVGSGNLVATGRNGIPVRTIGRSGQGPGEYVRPIAVMSNGTHLYIYDDGLKRVNVFDAEFSLVDTFEFTDAVNYKNRMKMNESYMAYQNRTATGLIAIDPDGYLLSVRPLADIDSVIFRAMPRIVPTGMQPGVYNNILISMNSHSEMLTGYLGLPYLFLYRDFQHTNTIVLESVQIDTTNNPSLRPTPPVGSSGVGISGILSHILLHDNSDILISSFRQLHHLKSNPNGGFGHYRTYCLIREDTGEQITTIREIDFFPDDPNRIYALGWGFLYEFRLPE